MDVSSKGCEKEARSGYKAGAGFFLLAFTRSEPFSDILAKYGVYSELGYT